MKSLFLRVLLVNSLFGCALAAGALAYDGHVHPVALVAIAVVLVAYAAGAAACLFLAWSIPPPYLRSPRDSWGRYLNDVSELAEALPGIALLGTAAGFLIALSGDAADIQHRISGAATGIISTFVGVACWLVLTLQHRLLVRHEAA